MQPSRRVKNFNDEVSVVPAFGSATVANRQAIMNQEDREYTRLELIAVQLVMLALASLLLPGQPTHQSSAR